MDAAVLTARQMALASKKGDVSQLEKLVGEGAPVDARESDEDLTPLMIALRAGHANAASWLLGQGASVEVWDGWGESPAHWAGSSVEGLELVAQAGGDMDYASVVLQDAPIHRAAREGRADSVEWLIAHGVEVDEGGDYYRTPLMMACLELKKQRRGSVREKQFMRVAEALVLAGADMKRYDNYSWTPLDALGGGAPGVFAKRLLELSEARLAIAERAQIERALPEGDVAWSAKSTRAKKRI